MKAGDKTLECWKQDPTGGRKHQEEPLGDAQEASIKSWLWCAARKQGQMGRRSITVELAK